MSANHRQLVSDVALEKMAPAGPAWAGEIEAALAQTPMAQPAAAAAHLRSILQRCLATSADGDVRLRIVEQARPLLATLEEGLARQLATESHPLPPTKARLTSLLTEVFDLQSRSLCLAIWELTGMSGRLPFLGRQRVLRAMHEGLELTRTVLLLAFQQYREPPAGAWRRLHALHGFATDVGAAHHKLAFPGEDGRRSIRERYAHTLLQALANPWGMQRQELAAADHVCQVLAREVVISPTAGDLAVHGRDPDSGPGRVHGDAGAEPVLRADLGRAIACVEQSLAAAESAVGSDLMLDCGRGSNGMEVRRSTVLRMLRAWQGHAHREFERHDAAAPAALVISMRQVHQVLAGGLDFDAFRERLIDPETPIRLADSPAAWLGAHAAAEAQQLVARILDESAGGYRLLWPEAPDARVRVGEIVALRRDGEEAGMSLGVLRWLRSQPGGQVVAGVELLGHAAIPAMVRVYDPGGRRGPLQRGILVGTRTEDRDLVIERVLDIQVASVEILWSPAGTSGERVALRRERHDVDGAEELSAAYYRVPLGVEEPEARLSVA